MWKRFTLAAYLVAAGANVYAKDHTPSDLNTKFDMKARGVDKLLSKAEVVSAGRSLDGRYYAANKDISGYSIQFQGCHHIQQWNEDADDEDVRLQTKRLARFRLVPYEKCDVVSPWANTKAIRDASRYFGKVDYGEYIVDLNTFVASYLEAKQEEDYYQNGDDGDDQASINIYDYVGCAQFNWEGDDDDDGNDDGNNDAVEYYFGPSCANQGGEIRMNLFSDDTCTTLVQCGTTGQVRGSKCYTRTTGYILPGTTESIIEDPCVPCTENYASLEQSISALEDGEKFDYDSYDFGDSRDVCTNLYDLSGKCERNMKNGEYNYACSYIEGIQIGVSKEGFAVAVRRSLVADAAMGTMVIASSFLGMYIYYMKNLLNKPLSSL